MLVAIIEVIILLYCIPVGEVRDTVNVSSNSAVRSSDTLSGSATRLVPSVNDTCPLREERSLKLAVARVTV